MSDWRNLEGGRIILSDGYADQPYIVKTGDGAWLCCVTVSSGIEGAPDQHVQTMRSTDCGRNWDEPVFLEPSDGGENSYAVMMKTPGGRIYIFYNHNSDRVREVLWHDRSNSFSRVDSLGHYVFKYSDDHGCSWSPKHYEIPVRAFKCDHDNVYGGKIRFFWNVGRPFLREHVAYVPLHKVGEMGAGFYQRSEGVLLASPNLMTEPNPEKVTWETLPDGDVGLKSPPGGGPIAEEQNGVVLSDGSICCSYRGIDGYGVEAYSRDGGHTFEPPHCKLHRNGSAMKNPRACNVVWKYAEGKYLYWFHNHGGHFIRALNVNGNPDGVSPYSDRNPVWICGGTEIDSPQGKELRWGNPAILLYAENPDIRISYPDFFEDDGRYYFTETQKSVAAVHEVPKAFLDGLFRKISERPPISRSAPGRTELSVNRSKLADGAVFRFELADDHPGVWCRSFDCNGFGFEFGFNSERRVYLHWSTPQETSWARSEILFAKFCTAEINIDQRAAIICFTIDGDFRDGGEERQFGWQRFSRSLGRLFRTDRIEFTALVERMEIYEE